MNYETTATIQLDKLVFSCTSTLEDNFHQAVRYTSSIAYTEQQFGQTTLIPSVDLSHRYRYSYSVRHEGKNMGKIDFCPFGKAWVDDRVRVTVDNSVFYTNTLCLMPQTLKDLHLQVENFTLVEVALDNYFQNMEQVIRRGLRCKENSVKLLGRIVKDRNKFIKEIITVPLKSQIAL